MIADAIYLNKRKMPSDDSHWAYYRITTKGDQGDDIEVCLVKWPSFQDDQWIGDESKSVVVCSGDTGFASAYPNLCTLLKNKWNIEHLEDDLIGIRERDG